MSSDGAQLPELIEKIDTLKARLNEVTTKALEDDVITQAEQKEIDRVRGKLDDWETKRRQLLLGSRGKGALGQGSGDAGAAGFDRDAEVARLSKRTCAEYREFRRSIEQWCTDAKVALNTAKGFIKDAGASAGITVADVMLIVSQLFPPSRFVAKSATILGAHIIRIFNAKMKSADASGGRVLANEVRNQMEAAVDEVRSTLDISYDSFLKERARSFSGPRDVERFFEDCIKFDETLPDGEEMKREFLRVIVSSTQDSWDVDMLAAVGKAGYVYLDIQCTASEPDLEIKAVFAKKIIDDVNESIVEALRNVWSGSTVTDLPFPIQADVQFAVFSDLSGVRRQVGTYAFTLWRKSREPGNTSFDYMWETKDCENDNRPKHMSRIESHVEKLIRDMSVSELDGDALG